MIALPPDALLSWVDETFVLDCTGLAAHQRALAGSLKRVGSARVPLHGAENTEIIAFRPADGGKEHLAIVIGNPDPAQPVLIRLHSECFTGDLLGSLRCDCGDQLRGAIRRMAHEGAGVAALPARRKAAASGSSTSCAPTRCRTTGSTRSKPTIIWASATTSATSGPPPRCCASSASRRVRLLTNNPEKIAQPRAARHRASSSRVPHIFPSNAAQHAATCVTKARRFGHMFAKALSG